MSTLGWDRRIFWPQRGSSALDPSLGSVASARGTGHRRVGGTPAFYFGFGKARGDARTLDRGVGGKRRQQGCASAKQRDEAGGFQREHSCTPSGRSRARRCADTGVGRQGDQRSFGSEEQGACVGKSPAGRGGKVEGLSRQATQRGGPRGLGQSGGGVCRGLCPSDAQSP